MEQRALIGGSVAAVAVCGLAALALASHRAHSAAASRTDRSQATGASVAADPQFDGDPRAHAPAGSRITVEIVNMTRIHGLARRGTFYLRDRGFDVVNVGTDLTRGADSMTTVVLDRTHHPEWAALAASALGQAKVEESPDTSRDVDLTVRLGAAWRPPAQPFYP